MKNETEVMETNIETRLRKKNELLDKNINQR